MLPLVPTREKLARLDSLDSRNAASVKDTVQLVDAVLTQFLKIADHRMISNIEDCPNHKNRPVLDTPFELAAQSP